jgi:hypothetical protein
MVAPEGTLHVYEVAPFTAIMEYVAPETPAGRLFVPEIAPGVAGVLVEMETDMLFAPLDPQVLLAITVKLPLAAPQA